MMSDYLKQRMAAWLTKRATFPTAPTAVYVSLHGGDPAGTGANELTTLNSPGYGRVTAATDLNESTHTNWNAPAASGASVVVTNKLTAAFGAAQGSWNGGNKAPFAGLWDAASGGNFLGGGALAGDGYLISLNDVASFAGGTPGQLMITIG